MVPSRSKRRSGTRSYCPVHSFFGTGTLTKKRSPGWFFSYRSMSVNLPVPKNPLCSSHAKHEPPRKVTWTSPFSVLRSSKARSTSTVLRSVRSALRGEEKVDHGATRNLLRTCEESSHKCRDGLRLLLDSFKHVWRRRWEVSAVPPPDSGIYNTWMNSEHGGRPSEIRSDSEWTLQ